MNQLTNFTKGIIKENPVLVLVLGTCPTLATSTNVSSALGMGAATTAVLLCSNIVISALRKIIPDKVRIPCFIVLIAGFVTMVQMLVKAFVPELDKSLGIYLPLISAIDGLGMGVGFTLTLVLMATIREVFGAGTWMGIEIPVLIDNHVSILTMAPGGFFVFGLLIAIVNIITRGKPKKRALGCAACPAAEMCGGECGSEEVAADD